jgi:hypothetical protein
MLAMGPWNVAVCEVEKRGVLVREKDLVDFFARANVSPTGIRYACCVCALAHADPEERSVAACA